MLRGVAPIEIRIAISGTARVTSADNTPWTPAPARSRATAAAALSSQAATRKRASCLSTCSRRDAARNAPSLRSSRETAAATIAR